MTEKLTGRLSGFRGYSAYEIAVQEGFDGTVDEWLESLKGVKGDKGEKGDRGADGNASVLRGIPDPHRRQVPRRVAGQTS
jgi:hypothetical protein